MKITKTVIPSGTQSMAHGGTPVASFAVVRTGLLVGDLRSGSGDECWGIFNRLFDATHESSFGGTFNQAREQTRHRHAMNACETGVSTARILRFRRRGFQDSAPTLSTQPMNRFFKFIIPCGVAAAMTVTLLAAEAAKAKSAPSPQPVDAVQKPDEKAAAAREVEWAGRLLRFLATDEDQQAAYGMKVAEAFAEAGHLEEARQVAMMVRDYRKTVVLYHLAERAARTGNKQLSAECMAAAEAAGRGTRDFEQEEIADARIGALAARGEVAQARKELDLIISKVVRAGAEARIFEFDRAEGFEKRVKEFAEREPVAPSVRGRALLFVARLHQKAGDKKAAVELTGRAITMICKLADVDTIPLLRQAVGDLVKLGEKKEAARWAGVCLGFAERTDPLAYWKARDMRLAAEGLLLAGEREKAAAVLKTIPNLPGRLDVFSYSRGATEAAQAFLLEGRAERFHEAGAHVVRMTRRHVHYRARAMGALDVLAAYAGNGIALCESVRKELEETARSIEADTNYMSRG